MANASTALDIDKRPKQFEFCTEKYEKAVFPLFKKVF
jgi:hypothetical protein